MGVGGRGRLGGGQTDTDVGRPLKVRRQRVSVCGGRQRRCVMTERPAVSGEPEKRVNCKSRFRCFKRVDDVCGFFFFPVFQESE